MHVTFPKDIKMFYLILTTWEVGLNYYFQFSDKNTEKFSDFA